MNSDPTRYQYCEVAIRATGKARGRTVTTSRGTHTYMPPAYVEARAKLRKLFGEVTVEPPWRIKVTAVRKMPSGWKASERRETDGAYNELTPDIDNMGGWVADALMKADDARIVDGRFLKVWGREAKVIIELWHAADVVESY